MTTRVGDPVRRSSAATSRPVVPGISMSVSSTSGRCSATAARAPAFADSDLSSCIPALVDAAERDADVRRFLHGYNARRWRALTTAIAAGRASGDLRADLDPELAATALAGAIVYQRLMTDRPFPAARVTELLTTVLGPDGA